MGEVATVIMEMAQLVLIQFKRFLLCSIENLIGSFSLLKVISKCCELVQLRYVQGPVFLDSLDTATAPGWNVLNYMNVTDGWTDTTRRHRPCLCRTPRGNKRD